ASVFFSMSREETLPLMRVAVTSRDRIQKRPSTITPSSQSAANGLENANVVPPVDAIACNWNVYRGDLLLSGKPPGLCFISNIVEWPDRVRNRRTLWFAKQGQVIRVLHSRLSESLPTLHQIA